MEELNDMKTIRLLYPDYVSGGLETYKNAKHLTGKQVAELFIRYNVWEYVYSCYEALHTFIAHYGDLDSETVLKKGVNGWRDKASRSTKLDVFLRIKGVRF